MPVASITTELHVATLAIGLTLVVFSIALVRRSVKSGHGGKARYAFGGAMLLLWIVYSSYYLSPAVFDWSVSLPLHACDIAGIVAIVAMLTQAPTSRTMLFFLGVPLTTQGLLTPVGEHDPATLRFWMFWGLHFGIIALSLIDLVAYRYRPTWRAFFLMATIDCAYVAAMLVLNGLSGWNYGYVGADKPGVTTAIDFLGPWPWRVAYLLLLVLTLQVAWFGAVSLFTKRAGRSSQSEGVQDGAG